MDKFTPIVGETCNVYFPDDTDPETYECTPMFFSGSISVLYILKDKTVEHYSCDIRENKKFVFSAIEVKEEVEPPIISLYVTPTTTARELLNTIKFKFADSAVFFCWADGNDGMILYMRDMDNWEHDHFQGGNFQALYNLDVDVPMLQHIFKEHDVILSSLDDTHDICLADLVDPFAELKKAYAAGKGIEITHDDGENWSRSKPLWKQPIESYRIKPDTTEIAEQIASLTNSLTTNLKTIVDIEAAIVVISQKLKH